MEWRIGVSLFLCSYLAYSVLAENATTAATGPCRGADAACDAQGIVGNISRPTGNSTNDGKSASAAAESGRARAMNFTSAFRDNTHDNEMETVARMHSKEHSIDDVSMDDMDDDNSLNFANFTFNTQTASGGGVGGEKGGGGGGGVNGNGNESINSKKSVAPMTKSANSGACTDRDGKVYKLGEKFTKGCDETCQCQKDGLVCSQQCKMPYTVKGRNKDPNCDEEPVEGSTCCVRLTCSAASDLEAEPLEDCIYKNVSYKRGSTINDDCESICICEASGHINCKSRCAPIQNVTDNCVALPDKKDPCCTMVLCDVEEHDVNKIGTTDDAAITSSSVDNQILAAVAVNETTVALSLAEKIKGCSVDVSSNGVHWENALCKDNKISGLQPGKKYYFRLKNTASNKVEVTLPSLNPNAATATSCTHKGKTYKIGEEFHDGCTAFCICEKGGVECALIECPTDFGLDVLDPHCLEWDKSPPGFVPSPPHCCPDKVYCRNNGSCKYNDEIFPNWTELPALVTGCDKICYCEMGNVSCQPSCPTVSETPPKNLPCAPEQAVLAHPPGDDCCTDWTCPNVARTGNESVATHSPSSPRNASGAGGASSDDTRQQRPNANHAPDMLARPPLPTPSSPLVTAANETKAEYYPHPYPGPFSPQYLSKKGDGTATKPHRVLTDLLSPFHLEEFAPQIDKELHANANANATQAPKAGAAKPTKYGDDDGDGDGDGGENEDNYDERNQYEDLFADIFNAKNAKKATAKQPFWTPIAAHHHPGRDEPRQPSPDTGKVGQWPTAAEEAQTAHDAAVAQQEQHQLEGTPPPPPTNADRANAFRPYRPQVPPPYALPKPVFSETNEPGPGQPPPPRQVGLLVHQQSHLPLGSEADPPAVGDANQPGQFYQITVDSDAYDDQQQQTRRPQHASPHLVAGQSVATRTRPAAFGPQQATAGRPDLVNLDDALLTQLRNQNQNQNENGDGHVPQHPRIHQVLLRDHHPNYPDYPFQNYPLEALNADQTSHPLLLHPELVSHGHGHGHNGNDSNRDEIRMRLLEAVDENTVRLVFSVPTFLVGLHGRVELRYTSDQQNNEPSTWEQQILAPPNDLIATKELEFELGGLQPNTTYKIKISVMMHDIDNAPSSSILTIKTLGPTSPPTTLPPILPVEPDMRVVEVNATYAKVAWRMFSDFELQFIDGVQLRYKELDDKIYAATPLIHRHVTTYTLEELKPDSTYEVKIFFVPFAGQTTELQAHQTVQIKTTVENDPYKFEVTMEVHHVKTTSIEISWSGVPYPEDKYVHIFRAIYQSDGNREDVSSFKAAKRDSSQSILIQDLKPGTRYRVWLEVYLTNGRTKKSNVKDFVTKHGLATTPSTSQGKLEGMAIVETNTYYGPLVAVSVLASIAIVTSVVLLLILAKKHGTNKAPITTPINRKTNSSAAYDNPSYKTYENDKNGNSMKNGSIALTVFPKTHIEKET